MGILVIFSVLASCIALLRWRAAALSQINIVTVLGLFGSIFIMLTAPGLRFGLGYMLLIPSWFIAILINNWAFIKERIIQWQQRYKTQAGTLWIQYSPIVCLSLLLSVSIFSPLRQQLIMPLPFPEANVTDLKINDIEYTYTHTENVLCWDTQQPCAIGPIEENIQLRDPERGLGAGFEYAQP